MSLVGQSRRFEPGSRISGLAPTPDISVVRKWLGPRRMISRSGSLAMFAAIRRASPLLSNFGAGDRVRPRNRHTRAPVRCGRGRENRGCRYPQAFARFFRQSEFS
jgi:hypothetical protein